MTKSSYRTTLLGAIFIAATASVSPAQTAVVPPAAPTPDRGTAYFHTTLAHAYEDMAATYGKSEYVTQAIEEYKLALNADPQSPELNKDLAELYFRTGRIREAIEAAKLLLQKDPNSLAAHKLLGRIYLRSLGNPESGDSNSGSGPSPQMVDLAIAEYEKVVQLEPSSVENHLLLGQLYTVKHDGKKAEAEFKAAQDIEPSSEEAVLSLARLYAESGDIQHATTILEAVPEANRTPRMEFVLGASYQQLKKPKEAIAAYKRAAAMDPENEDAARAFAQALNDDGQYDAALKQYQQIAEQDPSDAQTEIRISEIYRRQGKYQEALTAIQKAKKNVPPQGDPSADELTYNIGYNEGLLLDVLGRYDEAAHVYEQMVDRTTHANGAYTRPEKATRSIFLERLAGVYREQNKTDLALATYQKMVDLGGDSEADGYQGQADTYRDAKRYNDATELFRKAVAASTGTTPEALARSRRLKLLLAWQLADTGKLDEGIALAKSLLTGKPEDRDVYLQMEQVYIRTRDWKDAEDALNHADPLSTSKEDKINLLFQRGALAERQHHLEQSEQYFRQVLALDPDNAPTLNYLGYMLADKTTKLTEAVKLTRKAVDLNPMEGAYLDSLGWAYFKLGQYELAEETLRKAVERTSTDPAVHDHLGDLYEKTGRIRLAATQWELSLAQYAKTSPADIEPGDVSRVQKKLEGAKVRLAKEDRSEGIQQKP